MRGHCLAPAQQVRGRRREHAIDEPVRRPDHDRLPVMKLLEQAMADARGDALHAQIAVVGNPGHDVAVLVHVHGYEHVRAALTDRHNEIAGLVDSRLGPRYGLAGGAQGFARGSAGESAAVWQHRRNGVAHVRLETRHALRLDQADEIGCDRFDRREIRYGDIRPGYRAGFLDRLALGWAGPDKRSEQQQGDREPAVLAVHVGPHGVWVGRGARSPAIILPRAGAEAVWTGDRSKSPQGATARRLDANGFGRGSLENWPETDPGRGCRPDRANPIRGGNAFAVGRGRRAGPVCGRLAFPTALITKESL